MIGLSFLTSLPLCSASTDCLAAAFQFTIDPDITLARPDIHNAGTTANSHISPRGFSFNNAVKISRIIGTYTLFVGVLSLLALEMVQVHYIRKLVPRTRRHS
jgi:hypothetical protein